MLQVITTNRHLRAYQVRVSALQKNKISNSSSQSLSHVVKQADITIHYQTYIHGMYIQVYLYMYICLQSSRQVAEEEQTVDSDSNLLLVAKAKIKTTNTNINKSVNIKYGEKSQPHATDVFANQAETQFDELYNNKCTTTEWRQERRFLADVYINTICIRK